MPRKILKKPKTEIKLLGTSQAWHPKVGAPVGNRRAWKTGVHSAPVRDMRRRIRAVHAHAREAMARAESTPKKKPKR